MSASACPTGLTLQSWRSGGLSEAEAAHIAQHLLACPQCREACIDSPPAPAAKASDFTFLQPARSPDEIGWLSYFRVLRVLGAGGMGIVFEAEDVRLQRRVALKVMKPDLAADSVPRTRFVREARAVAALSSPHIVTIFHVALEGDVPFMAMELLAGQSLRQRLETGPDLSPAEVARIGVEVCVGLKVAHEAGLIHRDIKPDNLWLDPGGRVRILDFGLARFAAPRDNLTRVGRTVGTPGYISPEQARGQRVDHRSDLFSLGCVLYELTTGKCPFQRDSAMASLTALVMEDPEPIRAQNPAVPVSLERLILQLLAKNADDRPASADLVARCMNGIERELSEGEAAPSSREFAPRRRREPAPFNPVENTRPDYDAETRDLLRHRLKAMAMVGSAAMVFKAANDLAWNHAFFAAELGSLALHVGTYLILRGPWILTPRQLRGLECLLIANAALVLILSPSRDILVSAARGEYSLAVAQRMGLVCAWSVMVLAYAIYIPSTWQRAACVMLPMSLVPAINMHVLADLSDRVREAFDLPFIQLSNGMPVLSALIGVYGVHIINSLRYRAFQAQMFGQYVLKEPIRRGPLGEVFRGEHFQLKRPCAIKVIRPSDAINADTLSRFERVLQVATTLNHAGIVDIYDYGRMRDKALYLVMELLPGMTSAEIVEEFGPLPPGRVVHLLGQACDALAEAHAFGFFHRNLKPTNLMVAHRGGLHDTVKLLDFGLDQDVTGKPVPAETARFMPPEQATGCKVDARCDIYALGAVAYYLITGRPVFHATNLMQLVVAHSRDPVVPPSAHNSAVPADLEAVILRCLEKAPEARFATAPALAEALSACGCARTWTNAEAAQWWQNAE